MKISTTGLIIAAVLIIGAERYLVTQPFVIDLPYLTLAALPLNSPTLI